MHFIPVILDFFKQRQLYKFLQLLALESLQFYKYAAKFKVSIPEFLSGDNTKARDIAKLSAEDTIWKMVCTLYSLIDHLLL